MITNSLSYYYRVLNSNNSTYNNYNRSPTFDSTYTSDFNYTVNSPTGIQGCYNNWGRKTCKTKRRNGKCGKDTVKENCKKTCKVCCGDVWTKDKCERKKWLCQLNKKWAGTVRRNCRKSCNKCQ